MTQHDDVPPPPDEECIVAGEIPWSVEEFKQAVRWDMEHGELPVRQAVDGGVDVPGEEFYRLSIYFAKRYRDECPTVWASHLHRYQKIKAFIGRHEEALHEAGLLQFAGEDEAGREFVRLAPGLMEALTGLEYNGTRLVGGEACPTFRFEEVVTAATAKGEGKAAG